MYAIGLLPLLCVLLGFTGYNDKALKRMDVATELLAASKVNDCADALASFPIEDAEMIYGARANADTALSATIFIFGLYLLHVFMGFTTVCAHGMKKSCACDKY